MTNYIKFTNTSDGKTYETTNDKTGYKKFLVEKGHTWLGEVYVDLNTVKKQNIYKFNDAFGSTKTPNYLWRIKDLEEKRMEKLKERLVRHYSEFFHTNEMCVSDEDIALDDDEPETDDGELDVWEMYIEQFIDDEIEVEHIDELTMNKTKSKPKKTMTAEEKYKIKMKMMCEEFKKKEEKFKERAKQLADANKKIKELQVKNTKLSNELMELKTQQEDKVNQYIKKIADDTAESMEQKTNYIVQQNAIIKKLEQENAHITSTGNMVNPAICELPTLNYKNLQYYGWTKEQQIKNIVKHIHKITKKSLIDFYEQLFCEKVKDKKNQTLTTVQDFFKKKANGLAVVMKSKSHYVPKAKKEEKPDDETIDLKQDVDEDDEDDIMYNNDEDEEVVMIDIDEEPKLSKKELKKLKKKEKALKDIKMWDTYKLVPKFSKSGFKELVESMIGEDKFKVYYPDYSKLDVNSCVNTFNTEIEALKKKYT